MTSVPASAEPHIRAVQAALNAAFEALPTVIKAHIGKRPDNDTNCVVIYGSLGELSGTLADRYADITIPIQLTAVGVGPEQATAYADAARVALLTASLAVDGRRVRPAKQVADQPVRRDDTVQPELYVATAQYEITSNPA